MIYNLIKKLENKKFQGQIKNIYDYQILFMSVCEQVSSMKCEHEVSGDILASVISWYEHRPIEANICNMEATREIASDRLCW